MTNSIISIVGLLSAAAAIILKYKGKIKLGFSFDRWSVIELFAGMLTAFVSVSLAFIIILSAGAIEIISIDFHTGTFFSGLSLLGFSAMTEEIMFRMGLLLVLIYFTKKVWLSIAIEIIFFGLIHIANPGADLFTSMSNGIGGLMYSLAFIYTGRIWMPFALHLFWNFSQAFYGFNISGMDGISDMFIVLTQTGHDLISGGEYGLEGSVVGVGARLLVILLIVLITKKMDDSHKDYFELKESILPKKLRTVKSEAEKETVLKDK